MINCPCSVIVLGLGASGEAAARLLVSEGCSVCVVDSATDARLEEAARSLEEAGAEVMLAAKTLPKRKVDLCVVSPGIRSDSAMVRTCADRGARIVPEFELGWSRFHGRTIAVTGSNGKSTCVKLCAECLSASGLKATACGNYGVPVSSICFHQDQPDWLVIEVSSFQLETVCGFRPDIGVLLNILPNHLDRHGTMSEYVDLKMRMFRKMARDDFALVDETNRDSMVSVTRKSCKINTFGTSSGADFRYEGNRVVCRDGEYGPIGVEDTMFDNAMLGLTAAAATGVCCHAGIETACLEKAIASFRGLPHRMQRVCRNRDVVFVDDSKSTNISATMAALAAIDGNIRLIAGGKPKGESYEPARSLLQKKGVTVYLMGESAESMEAAWHGVVPCVRCGDLNTCVAMAWKDAGAGDVVLFSPGCASFDQFRNFGERGEAFQRLVQSL